MHNRFIEHYMISRRVILFQQMLAPQPGLRSLLNYLQIHFRRYSLNNSPSVGLSLQ